MQLFFTPEEWEPFEGDIIFLDPSSANTLLIEHLPERVQQAVDQGYAKSKQAYMLEAIRQDIQPAIGGEDGRATIELITAIYESGATGRTVALPLRSDDPFYTVAGIMGNVPHFYEKSASVMELNGDITLGSSYGK